MPCGTAWANTMLVASLSAGKTTKHWVVILSRWSQTNYRAVQSAPVPRDITGKGSLAAKLPLPTFLPAVEAESATGTNHPHSVLYVSMCYSSFPAWPVSLCRKHVNTWNVCGYPGPGRRPSCRSNSRFNVFLAMTQLSGLRWARNNGWF